MSLGSVAHRARCVDLGPGPSPTELVRRVADWPGLVALVGAWGDHSAVLTSHPVSSRAADADPTAVLDDQPAVVDTDPTLIGGGWFGRLAFDGPSALAFHDHVVRLVDGRWRFESLECGDRVAALAGRLAAWRAVLAAPDAIPDAASDAGSAWSAGPFRGPPAAEHYAAVERAVELIRAGELYQVNVCTRLRAPFVGSSAGLFAAAVAELQPGYAAYLAGERPVISLSPEQFLVRRGRGVTSSPIKGTVARSGVARGGELDDHAAALRRSAKDVAENVMIVDLVRNDLGRVAATGSVHVDQLLDVRAHPGVWHLVSTVSARLRPDVSDGDLLRATFPPGSVTGAPKIRALDVIAALEPVARGSYTGAIGFSSPLWGAEFSVAIRTFEVADGGIELGVGGGVTADSVPALEWQECLHKAAPLLRAARADVGPELVFDPPRADPSLLASGLLETVLGIDGVAVRLADHLARLDRSCRELFGAGLPPDLPRRLITAAATVAAGRAVLRVTARPDLQVDVSVAPAPDPSGPSHLTCVPRPGGLWRHKWADRAWAAGADAALFVASDGTALETARGNVFLIEADGTLVTSPLRDDLLPGVTRRAVLDHARDQGRPTALRSVSPAELIEHPAFWTSSLSGAVPIHSLDGRLLPRADDLVSAFARAVLGGASPVR